MTRRPNRPVAAISHQGEAISLYCHFSSPDKAPDRSGGEARGLDAFDEVGVGSDPVLTGLQMLAAEMADFVLHLQTIDPRPASWPGRCLQVHRVRPGRDTR